MKFRKSVIPWWLSLIFWIALIAPGNALEVRVAIKKNIQQLAIGTSTPGVVKDRAGRQLGEISELTAFNVRKSYNNISISQWHYPQLWLEPSSDGYVWIEERWYRGRVQLLLDGNGITVINHIDLEEYLYSVVGAETPSSWPLEALKAQAVAARSYALYQQSRSSSSLYDLDNTTASQVYKGLDSEYSSTLQAVNETAGEVMTYNGKVILAVFHSSSGGHTENVENIWNNSLPYLRGVWDFDHRAPVYQWSKTFSTSELNSRLPGVGGIRSITIERKTPQGRVVTMMVRGDRGSKRFSGGEIRRYLGLRSTLFTISPTGQGFIVQGRGFGHGVGLSQWGAHYLAQSGYNYDQILTHYYQNIRLTRI